MTEIVLISLFPGTDGKFWFIAVMMQTEKWFPHLLVVLWCSLLWSEVQLEFLFLITKQKKLAKPCGRFSLVSRRLGYRVEISGLNPGSTTRPLSGLGARPLTPSAPEIWPHQTSWYMQRTNSVVLHFYMCVITNKTILIQVSLFY